MSERDIAKLTRLLGTAIQNICEMRKEMNQRFGEFREEMNLRFDKIEQRLKKIKYQMKIMASDVIQLRAEDARLNGKLEQIKEAA